MLYKTFVRCAREAGRPDDEFIFMTNLAVKGGRNYSIEELDAMKVKSYSADRKGDLVCYFVELEES